MNKSNKVFFLFLCFITSFAFAAPEVESVAISGDKLIVTGHKFLDIDGLTLSDPQTGFKKPFKVQSATESEIVGTAVDNQKITVASLMNLIIDTAKGETTYPVSFSLQKDAVTNPTIKNGAITPEKFVGVTTPNPPDQSVLTWDEPTQSFIFTSGSEGGGSSGVSDIVLGPGITGAPNTASGSVPISVDIGATGSTSKTKIPYFNSKNKIVLDSTTSPVGSLTGLSFKDGTQNFYMFNDNGLRVNSNAASDLLVMGVDGNLFLKGPVTVGGYDVCLSSGNCTSAPSGTSTVTATAPLIAATTATGTTNISAGAVNTANNLVKLDAAGKFPATIPGVVRGPGTVTAGTLAVYSNTTGENLGNSGVGLQNLVTMPATPTTANKIVISTGANRALGTTSYTIPNTSGVTGQILALTATDTASWINAPASGVTSFKTRTGAVVPATGDYTATQITSTAGGSVSATTVQAAITELDTEKLPISGGTMTGTIKTTTQKAIFVGAYGSDTGEIRFFEIEPVAPSWVGFKAPANIATSTVWTLPGADGTSGQVLSTNGSKVLSWTTAGAAGGIGDVVGPATSTLNNLATFSGATGKNIKDSGINSGNLPTMATAATAANKIIISAGPSKQLTTTLYPIPPAIGASGTVLKSDGTNVTWQPDSGGAGNVVGPATSAANALAQFSDTTGKIIKGTAWTVPSTVGSANQVLKSNGTNATWQAVGDVAGPATSTANMIAAFSDTTGKKLSSYGVGINSSNDLWGVRIMTLGSTGSIRLDAFNNRVGIGGGAALHILQLDSTDSGFLPPRMTTAQKNAIPSQTTGLVIYDTDLNALSVRSPSGWTPLKGGDVVGPAVATVANRPALYANTTGKLLTEAPYTLPITAGTTGQVLGLTGAGIASWVNAGNVAGAATSTTNAISKYSDTTGKNLINSGVLINASNDISGIAKLTSTGDLLVDTNTFKVDATNNRVGIGTASPSQVFQIDSTTSGFLPPRMSTAQKDAIPTQTTGLVVFDTTLNSLSVRKSTGWAGTGDVVGPAVATVASRPALYADASGKLLKEAPYTLPITAGTTGQVLGLTGAGAASWVNAGNVAGAATSTTNAISKYSDTTGKNLINSGVLINASNDISGIAKLTSTGDLLVDTNTFKVDATNNRVGIGTTAPSQVFQIDSTTSGFLPPRMSTAQKDAIPTQTTGLVIYDTDLNALSVRSPSGWTPLKGGDVVGPAVATVANRPALYANTTGKLLTEAPYTLPITAGTTGQVLGLTGAGIASWVNAGNVAGAATSTTNAISKYSDTTGKNLINSGVLINASNDISGIAKLTSTGDLLVDTNTFKVDATNNRVGIGTASPSQVFQIDSTTSGFLPPRMSTAQKDAIPTQTTGLVVFDTTLNSLSVRKSTGWAGTGDVVGPAVATVASRPALYADASGKLLKEAPYTLPITAGTTGQVLGLTGAGAASWVNAGNVAGAATSTTNAISKYSDTTGKNLINSGVLINASNDISGIAKLTSTGDLLVDTNTFKVDATNNRVGIGTTAPSQVFQIDSTTSGFLPPRMSTAQKDAIPTQTTGLMVFDTTLNSLSVRKSTGWAATGDVVGPSVATIANRPALYSDTSGKLIKEAPYTLPLGAGTTGQVLGLTGAGIANWVNTGNVVGAATSTTNAIATFAGTDGKTLKSTAFTINGRSLQSSIASIGENSLVEPTNLYHPFACFSYTGHGGDDEHPGFCQNAGAETRIFAGATFELWVNGSKVLRSTEQGTGGSTYHYGNLSNSGTLTNTGNLTVGPSTLFVDSTGGRVGIGTSPNPSAILDLSSTNKGLLLPRLSTAAIATPTTGLLIFDTSTNSLNVRNSTGWIALKGDVVGPAVATVANRPALYADTTGKLIKEAPYTLPLSAGTTGQVLGLTGAGIANWVNTGNVVGAATSTLDAISSFAGTDGKTLKNTAFKITGNNLIGPKVAMGSNPNIVPGTEYGCFSLSGHQTSPDDSGYCQVWGEARVVARNKVSINATYIGAPGPVVDFNVGPDLVMKMEQYRTTNFSSFWSKGNLYVGAKALTVDSVNNLVGIGTTNTPAQALEINSSTHGFLPPRMSTAEREAIPQSTGVMVFDTSLNSLFIRNAIGWIPLSGSVAGPANSTPNGIAIFSDHLGKTLISSSVTINPSTGDMAVDTNTLKVDAANNRVGIGTASPSQVFQIDSTTSGFLPPRMTTAQRDAIVTQTPGMVVFDTTLNALSVRNSTGWVSLSGTALLSVNKIDELMDAMKKQQNQITQLTKKIEELEKR